MANNEESRSGWPQHGLDQVIVERKSPAQTSSQLDFQQMFLSHFNHFTISLQNKTTSPNQLWRIIWIIIVVVTTIKWPNLSTRRPPHWPAATPLTQPPRFMASTTALRWAPVRLHSIQRNHTWSKTHTQIMYKFISLTNLTGAQWCPWGPLRV